MRIGVSGRADIAKRVRIAEEVLAVWKKIGGEDPQIAPDMAGALDRGEGVPVDEMDADVIVTVGGDGTLLWTLMRNPEAKLLGVNEGELGYLTEVQPDSIEPALKRLHDGDYFIETRCKLAVRKDGERLGTCANEVVVKTPRPSKILTFRVEAEDHVIEDVRADGLIVSTPTGSTSYAMSAGGPLVHPELQALLLVPLAPFRVSLRPIVLPVTTTLTVTLEEEEKQGALALDGQVEHTLEPGEELSITRSAEQARFVRFEPHFFSRMRELFG